MNFNDYEALWKRQPLPLGWVADPVQLRATFEDKSRKMNAAFRGRDLAEAGASLLVIAAYAYFWWQVGSGGWPLAFGIMLILGVGGFFIRERLRVRRQLLGFDAPLLAKVDADIAELRHQCRLLRTVWAWYLAPCIGAMAIQFRVIYHRSPAWSPVREPWFLLGCGVFLAAVIVAVWLMNQKALRTRLEPRLAELEKLRRELLAGAGIPFP
jgi:hypothetical protein